MFEDIIECINLLVLPKYSFLSRCKSIEYMESGFEFTTSGGALIFTLVKTEYEIVNQDELRDELKTLFKMLGKSDEAYYSVFFWIKFDYEVPRSF